MLWRYQIGKIQNNITYISSGVIYNGSLGTYQYRVSENHWYVLFGIYIFFDRENCCLLCSFKFQCKMAIEPRIIIFYSYLLENQALSLSSVYINSRISSLPLKIIRAFFFSLIVFLTSTRHVPRQFWNTPYKYRI